MIQSILLVPGVAVLVNGTDPPCSPENPASSPNYGIGVCGEDNRVAWTDRTEELQVVSGDQDLIISLAVILPILGLTAVILLVFWTYRKIKAYCIKARNRPSLNFEHWPYTTHWPSPSLQENQGFDVTLEKNLPSEEIHRHWLKDHISCACNL